MGLVDVADCHACNTDSLCTWYKGVFTILPLLVVRLSLENGERTVELFQKDDAGQLVWQG